MRIVDAHHHLWDLGQCRYPWLEAKGVKRFFGDPAPIQKNYLVEDLRADAREYELLGSVHIQVGAALGYELKETEWLQQNADAFGLPSAIVAFCDLSADDLEASLDKHLRFKELRGVRQIVGRSADEDAVLGTDSLIDDERWRDGLRLLREKQLSFDLQLIPRQLPRMAEVLADVPGLNVALCHCGSPWDQDEIGLAAWRNGLENLAALPDVHCKISGLAMFDHDWSVETIRPIVETCLDVFGIERCMFGSNFPVDKLHKRYEEIWSAYANITAPLTDADRERLFVNNARTFYRF